MKTFQTEAGSLALACVACAMQVPSTNLATRQGAAPLTLAPSWQGENGKEQGGWGRAIPCPLTPES